MMARGGGGRGGLFGSAAQPQAVGFSATTLDAAPVMDVAVSFIHLSSNVQKRERD